ncbi:hypothetical protein [Sphingomonas crocodyli]|uniref:Uncharacterized protein n=1 Tax=Sphingomonas crocodyli TaxID=1979270 RepID=A0A437LWG6_9SPHN|nr:hypothetical protein [Sphingomonas crocodyli]RVT89709.1 hypothetical protein EOD43_20210 [Sphingomonas crocodyli]
MGEPNGYDEQAAEIIKLYGSDAIPHIVHLIEKAVKDGDDAAVERLDQMLAAVERATPHLP